MRKNAALALYMLRLLVHFLILHFPLSLMFAGLAKFYMLHTILHYSMASAAMYRLFRSFKKTWHSTNRKRSHSVSRKAGAAPITKASAASTQKCTS